MRIACYGVRPNEIDFFEKLNIYHYDLSLYEELLTHDNIVSAKDHDAVLLRGNCIADETNLAKMQEYGIRYVFTRTVGVNHIDLQAAADFGMTSSPCTIVFAKCDSRVIFDFCHDAFEKYCVYDDPNIFQRFSSG